MHELQHFSNIDDLMLTLPNMDDFCKFETVGIISQEEKEDDEAVMDHFKRSVKKEDGRYHAAWLCKDENSKFPE